MDGNPVLAFWNYLSAPVPRDQITVFIDKIRDKTSPSMYLSFFCDARHTDPHTINSVEKGKDLSIHHASAVSMVERLCAEMCKLTGFYDDPGWIVLIADSDSYGPTLTSLSREGWKVMIVHPNAADWTFFDYADETYRMDDLIEDQDASQVPPFEARAFLVQVSCVSSTQFSALLGPGQQCVYFNPHTKEAVIVIEAENEDKIRRSLELLIGRVCAAAGVQPSDVLPFPIHAMVSNPPAPPQQSHVLVAVPPSSIVAPQGNNQGPGYGNMQRHTAVYLHSSPDSDRILTQTEYGMKQNFALPPPGFNEVKERAKSARSAESSERSDREMEPDEKEASNRMNAFGENPWKKAEERFKRRAWQQNPPNRENSMSEESGADSDAGGDLGGGRNRSNNGFMGGGSGMGFDRKTNPFGGGSGANRDRFRKPAPQCVFWENRRHRQETGCTLWHPRESCRFYPTCAHQAQECGFAHPFCGLKCHCPPDKRNPQMNHWTDQLQRAFGVTNAQGNN